MKSPNIQYNADIKIIFSMSLLETRLIHEIKKNTKGWGSSKTSSFVFLVPPLQNKSTQV